MVINSVPINEYNFSQLDTVKFSNGITIYKKFEQDIENHLSI